MKRLINIKKSSVLFILLSSVLLVSGCQKSPASNNNTVTPLTQEWQPLLDKNLSQWEVWMGVPHTSVKGLPEGTYQSNQVSVHGDPSEALGLNNDVKNVFTMIEEDGQPVLHISGEIYGGVNTKAHYKNFHFSLQTKWGDKKWAPRLKKLRDSGILFHCRGEHGAFWKVWKLCQEFQVQETDLGDYIPLGNKTGKVKGKIRARSIPNSKRPVYDPAGKLQNVGYASAYPEVDKPHGQWNTLELYAIDDKAVFVVNNEVVMAIENSQDSLGQLLDSGQLQLQSEGAELYYRDVKIKALNNLPSQFERYFN